MRILLEQLNRETFELEVTGEMTMRDVKMQIKRVHKWEDEMSRNTTLVEVILGDKKVTNEETVDELGICEGSKVSLVFRKNKVKRSDKGGLGPDLDPEALVIVEIPDSETEIKALAFSDCRQVAKVIIPSSVTQIGGHAFRGCSSLKAIDIPDSATQIGDQAFSNCRSLAAINIPDTVTQIGHSAFFNCSSLVTINIPDCVPRIGQFTFFGCSSLVAIQLPNSVTQIGDYAFNNCSSLTSVDIPDSVTSIGLDAFTGCKQLTLTAPARLLGPEVSRDCKFVAKECADGKGRYIYTIEYLSSPYL